MKNLIFAPFLLCTLIIYKFTGFFQTSLFLSRVPFVFGNILRNRFYSKVLQSVGKNVFFPYGIVFSNKNISIGNNVRFGPFNTIGLVDFESDILIAQSVHFLSGKNQHDTADVTSAISKQKGVIKRITVSKNSWIGCGSIVMANIGSDSVVGAGSIVTKNIDSFCIVAGNPAKLIRKR